MRRLLTILSAMSLLLFIATMAVWARSYWVWDDLLHDSPVGDWHFANMRGAIFAEHTLPLDASGKVVTRTRSYSGAWGWHYRHDEPGMIDRLPGSHAVFWSYGQGFGIATGERWGDYHYAVKFPHWFLVVLAAVLPIVVAFTKLRRLPVGDGCVRCGYNLTGNMSGICPECGTPVHATQAASP